MLKNFGILVCLIFSISAVGCVSVKTVSLTSVPAQRTKVVKAEDSRFLFLGISFSTQFIDSAIENLSGQCPSGKIEGILTKHEVVNYFLWFFMTERVTAKGFCQ